MPRTYVRKRIKKYTSQDLATAVDKVKSGELTQYRAAQVYNIPLTTIHEHVQDVKSNHNAGRPTALLLEDEQKIAETIVVMEKWGFGLSRFEILELVGEYVRVNNIQTPFKNNTPGPDWFINFRKRHRLSIKKAQPLEFLRKKMTDPFIIGEYFDLLKDTLNDLNLFEGPQFIWNLDETSLCLDPTRTKVVGKMNKPCARTTQGSGKENITVLAGGSASGKKLPPLIVYKGKYVWDTWMADLNSDEYDFEITYAASAKGWMETEIFYNYMEKVLIPSLGEERPVLIIYDGHSTHVDVRVVQLAIKNQITILKLPPHTSHLLQPLDISVFKSFKMIWDAKLVEWQRKNIGTKMPKKTFAQTLADTWQQTDPENIKSGFKKAGIHPFNDKVIPIDVYDPEAYKRYQKFITERNLAHTQLNLKIPKTLKQTCIDLLNKQLLAVDCCEKTTANEVISLSQLSKSDIQNLAFVAEHPVELPTCLEERPTQSRTQNSPKVNIMSNIIIKEAFVPSQNPVQVQSQRPFTFEELVLRKIQQDKKENISTKKKRITKGAEVITAAVGKSILEMETTSRPKTATKTSKNKEKSTKVMEKVEKEIAQPGPSGIQKKNKRKRQPSTRSTTSISDIISEHDDSDIIDYADFDALFGKYSDNVDSKNPEDKKCGKRIKRCEKSEEKILANEPSCRISSKSKGKGKRSKGKENESSMKNKRKRPPSTRSTTSISDIISEHDDSDIIDYADFDDLFGIYSDNVETKTPEDKKYGKRIKRCEKSEEKILATEPLCRISSKGKGKGKRSKGIENDSSILNVSVLEEKDREDKENEAKFYEERFTLRETVLVRYLIRKKWKYYVGFIEDIKHNREETYYTILFLKTTRLQQELNFIVPKKKDIDEIPESLIVKKIDIRRNTDNEKVYYLCNEEDAIYFSFV